MDSSSNHNNEESLMNRIQVYISTLESSNSTLETQLFSLKEDLQSTKGLSQQLQFENNELIGKTQESDGQNRLIQVFLSLHLQEKEIFIKNIDLLLTKLQNFQENDKKIYHVTETLRMENQGLRISLEGSELELKHLKSQLGEKDSFFERERGFLKQQIKVLEGELYKEKEKEMGLERRILDSTKQNEEMKVAIKIYEEEKQKTIRKTEEMIEENNRLERILLNKRTEIQNLRVHYEEVIKKYEEGLRPLINQIEKIKEEVEQKGVVLENKDKELISKEKEIKILKETYEEKLNTLTQDLQAYTSEETLMKAYTYPDIQDYIKTQDADILIKKLIKGYFIERTKAINSAQIIRNLKDQLSEKFEILYKKYEEWNAYKKKTEELKQGYEILNKRVRDLMKEKEKTIGEKGELIRKIEGLEGEKKELLQIVDKMLEGNVDGKYIKEVIEKNLEMMKRLEEIYKDNYFKI